MKSKFLLALFITINLLSCSTDDSRDQEETLSFDFQVEVENVTDRSATATWTKPQGSNISYQIFLNNDLIEDNFSQTAYTFNGLSGETNYSGKIVATNGSQSTTVDFSFQTETFNPKTFKGNVVLLSQEDVINFGNDHYNIIDGYLAISKTLTSTVVDLTPLKDLMKVTGSVEIRYTSLKNLEGMENLIDIGGILEINENDILVSLKGLNNLESIDDYIYVSRNSSLKNMNDLESLKVLDGVIVTANLNLETINFLNDTTNGIFIEIANNPKLKTITGFRKLKTLSSYLFVLNNTNLLNFAGFNSLENVSNDLDIKDNDNLEVLSLNNLESVGRDFSINRNNSITNLDGVSSLSDVAGDFGVYNNALLSDLCGIKDLIVDGNIQGDINIGNNLYNPTIQDFINGDCKQ